MRTIVKVAPGSVDVVEQDDPVVGIDEVLVDVVYGSINGLDHLALSRADGDAGLRRVIGAEVVGRVEGELVLVTTASRDGGFAERIAVPSSAIQRVPAGVDAGACAAAGIAGRTAWRLVHQIAAIGPEERVLVLGASGGVGLFAAQLAKATGAVVVAQTTHPSKVDRLRDLGLEAACAETPADLESILGGLRPDAIIDPLGGDWTAVSAGLVADRGRVVVCGSVAGAEARIDLRALIGAGACILSTSGRTTSAAERAEAAAGAFDAVVTGSVVIPVQRFRIHDAQGAFDLFAARENLGKAVIAFGEPETIHARLDIS